jgi:hypothetical protein
VRIVGIVALSAALVGCVTSRQEVATRLGAEYIGQNVDAMVIKFGPPASSFKMNSGGTSYVWQLSAVTDINVDRGSGTASTRYCKVNVVTSPDGKVIDLRTEDTAYFGGILGGGFTSMCAQRLGMKPQS